jgi:uncharacterized protein (DUF433 family)
MRYHERVIQEALVETWIEAKPGVLGGKPCIRGTRISVEFLLELMASGASREDIGKAYPQVTEDALSAALQYAARSLKNELVWDVKISA